MDSTIVMVNLTEDGKINTVPVSFKDTVKNRGKVYGNTERKIGGAILALTELHLLGFTVRVKLNSLK